MVSDIVYFHPNLGKIPNLTDIFQRGWNHQLDFLVSFTKTPMLGNKPIFQGSTHRELLQAGDYWYTTPPERLHIVSVFLHLIACFSLVHIVYDIYLPILWNHSNNDWLLSLFDNNWLFSVGGLHYIVIPSKDTYKLIDVQWRISPKWFCPDPFLHAKRV